MQTGSKSFLTKIFQGLIFHLAVRQMIVIVIIIIMIIVVVVAAMGIGYAN